MHTAFPDRLAAKGVKGKAWRLVDAMYRNAASRVRLQGKLSAQIDVRCGVAQGCPLSPFLYAVFADATVCLMQSKGSARYKVSACPIAAYGPSSQAP